MTLVSLVLVLAILVSFVYMFLGLLAYNHQSDEKNVDKGWVLSPIWAFFPSAYDEKGQSLCATGRIFFWLATLLMIIWVVLDYLLE